MKNIFTFLFVFLFLFNTYADNHIIEVETISTNKKVISLLYPENHLWVYERFFIQEGMLQEKLSRRSFESKKQALDFIKPKKHFSTQSIKFNFVDTESSSHKVWKDTNQWSANWEKKYSQWYVDNVTKDFFVKYNIATDCADAAIAFRWIFSRINSLPAGQSLAGTGSLFTNRSFKSSWKRLKRHRLWYKDKVFMASLRYLVNNTYTHSLGKDSYPVAMTREHLTEGAFRLTLNKTSGHTVLIHRQNIDGIPLNSLNSTVPKTVRSLSESIFIPRRIKTRKEGGLVKPLWIVRRGNKLVKLRPRDMPGYSLEQYDEEFGKDNFAITVLKRVQPNFDPVVVYKAAFVGVSDFIKSRIQVVIDGFKFCQTNDCAPGSQNYEDWSTPSRDKQLQEKMNQLSSLYSSFSSLDPKVPEIHTELKSENRFEISGEAFNYSFISEIWPQKYFSSDPRATMEQRWALAPKNFVASAFSRLVKAHNKKVKKINAVDCNNKDCTVGTPGWLSEQTVLEDSEIKTHFIKLFEYCSWMGENSNCKEYIDNFVRPLMVDDLGIIEYAKQVLFSNFEVEAPQASRMGKSSAWDVELFFSTDFMGSTKSFLISQSKIGNFYYSYSSNEKRELPFTGQVITTSAESDELVYKDEQKRLYLFNFDNSTSTLIHELKKGDRLKKVYINNNYFIIATNNIVKLSDVSNTEPKVLFEHKVVIVNEKQKPDSSSGEPILVVKSTTSIIDENKFYLTHNRMFYAFDLLSGENIIKRSLPQSVKEDYFKIDNISKKRIYIRNYTSDDFYRTLVFDKNKGYFLHKFFEKKRLQWLAGSDHFYQASDNSEGFRVSELLENMKVKDLVSCQKCSATVYDNYIIYKDEISKNKKLVYTYNGSIFQHKPEFGKITGFFGKFIIERKDKKIQFKKVSDGSLYMYEGVSGYSAMQLKDGLLLIKVASEIIKKSPFNFKLLYHLTNEGELQPFSTYLYVEKSDEYDQELANQYKFVEHLGLAHQNEFKLYNTVSLYVDHNHWKHIKGEVYSLNSFKIWLRKK